MLAVSFGEEKEKWLTMKSCRSNCLLQQTEEMPCYMKDCVGVDEDMTVTKTMNEVGLGVGGVRVIVSVMSATSVTKTQRRSPTQASEYACGKAALRESQEFVLGEEGVALRVTFGAAKCRAWSVQ